MRVTAASGRAQFLFEEYLTNPGERLATPFYVSMPYLVSLSVRPSSLILDVGGSATFVVDEVLTDGWSGSGAAGQAVPDNVTLVALDRQAPENTGTSWWLVTGLAAGNTAIQVSDTNWQPEPGGTGPFTAVVNATVNPARVTLTATPASYLPPAPIAAGNACQVDSGRTQTYTATAAPRES